MNGKNIYVLGIGINEYEVEGISDLEQCERDIDRVKKFFISSLKVPESNYKVLSPKETCREGIITAFRTHFGNLRRGDIAVLNYSGHGSWEKPAKEFIEAKFESSTGQIEGIVPRDARVDGVRIISDKEIRLLVNEIQYTDEGKEKGVQFVGIFDCCYSGSMLKFDQSKER